MPGIDGVIAELVADGSPYDPEADVFHWLDPLCAFDREDLVAALTELPEGEQGTLRVFRALAERNWQRRHHVPQPMYPPGR